MGCTGPALSRRRKRSFRRTSLSLRRRRGWAGSSTDITGARAAEGVARARATAAAVSPLAIRAYVDRRATSCGIAARGGAGTTWSRASGRCRCARPTTTRRRRAPRCEAACSTSTGAEHRWCRVSGASFHLPPSGRATMRATSRPCRPRHGAAHSRGSSSSATRSRAVSPSTEARVARRAVRPPCSRWASAATRPPTCSGVSGMASCRGPCAPRRWPSSSVPTTSRAAESWPLTRRCAPHSRCARSSATCATRASRRPSRSPRSYREASSGLKVSGPTRRDAPTRC
mmetsp:Transcript_15407/g.38195  ORF Transcript_15407/g.38195 Transcript_15407/m.38195 type:complete len:286 (+) Transcript_15407:317-1174(+)